MAITRISSTKNGLKALNYALDEKKIKDENTSEKGMRRVLSISGNRLDTKFVKEQMTAVWESFNVAAKDKIQLYRVIQSFSEDELNYKNRADIKKANAIGLALAKKMYPDRQAVVVTQADGVGHKLHNHILVNSISAKDGKSIRDLSTTWYRIAQASDEIIKTHGMTPLNRDKDNEISYDVPERLITNKPLWKDRIRKAIDDVKKQGFLSFDEFKYMLSDHHIGVLKRGNTLTYEISPNDDKTAEIASKRLKKVRGKKLGEDYTLEAINKVINKNVEEESNWLEVRYVEEAERQILENKSIEEAKRVKEANRERQRAYFISIFNDPDVRLYKKTEADLIKIENRPLPKTSAFSQHLTDAIYKKHSDKVVATSTLKNLEQKDIVQEFIRLRAKYDKGLKPVIEQPQQQSNTEQVVPEIKIPASIQKFIDEEEKAFQEEYRKDYAEFLDSTLNRSSKKENIQRHESAPTSTRDTIVKTNTIHEPRTLEPTKSGPVVNTQNNDNDTESLTQVLTGPTQAEQQREEQVRRQQQEEQRLREIAQQNALEDEEEEYDDGLDF